MNLSQIRVAAILRVQASHCLAISNSSRVPFPFPSHHTSSRFLKKGEHAESTILCALHVWPSQASVTSRKFFSVLRCLKEDTMLDWKSFHRRQYCWLAMAAGYVAEVLLKRQTELTTEPGSHLQAVLLAMASAGAVAQVLVRRMDSQIFTQKDRQKDTPHR